MTLMFTSYFFLVFNIVDVEVNFITGYYPIGIIGIYISLILLSIALGICLVFKNRLTMYFIRRR